MTSTTTNLRFGRLAASVFTRDIQAAEAFYCDILGFTKTFENGDPVGFIVLEKDQAELHLSLVRDHRPSTANVAHLMVDDVDALHKVLAAAGVRIIKSLSNKDYGLRAFVFTDPDGNRIDVGQPLSPTTPPGFDNRDLSGVGFTNCRLAGASFEDVDLTKARFQNVDLSGVTIDDARIDGLTIFGMDIQALIRAELARQRKA